jgi:AcrR family transcriptional regulator
MSARGARPYASQLRAEQAQQTRKRIVDAAAALFAERGFGGTTIDAVAAAAGVSRKTVFDSVGGKVQLIKHAYDYAIVGDAEPVPLSERDEIAELVAEPDAVTMLAKFAAVVATINARVAPLYRALHGAAATDDEARALLQTLENVRHRSMREPAGILGERHGLRAGLSRAKAADLLWVLTDPGLYDKLVLQAGWSDKEFRSWLAGAFQLHLLGPAAG